MTTSKVLYRVVASLLLAGTSSLLITSPGLSDFSTHDTATVPAAIPTPAAKVKKSRTIENGADGQKPSNPAPSTQQAAPVQWNETRTSDGHTVYTAGGTTTCSFNGKIGQVHLKTPTINPNTGEREYNMCHLYSTPTDTEPVESEIEPTDEFDYQAAMAQIHEKYVSIGLPKPKLGATTPDKLLNGAGILVLDDENVSFYTTLEGNTFYEGELNAGHTRIEVVPVAYVYHYGDNHKLYSHDAGSSRLVRMPNSGPDGAPAETSTSHVYSDTGNFHAYVEVIYAGRFRVENGPWQWFEDRQSAWSDPVLVRSFMWRSYPVAKTCKEDPRARGCGQKPDWDNPNPRLRVADMRTGSKYHADASGRGDSEWWYEYSWWPYK